MKTLISTAAMILMFGGVAFAQDDVTTQAVDPNEPDQMGLWDDPEIMGPFFTDDTMTVLRPVEDVRAAFMAMPEEDRTAMMTQCEDVDTIQSESIKLEEFCGVITDM